MKELTIMVISAVLLTGCQSYKVENGQWSLIHYNEGVGRSVARIDGADKTSFTPINREYAKDKSRVYFEAIVIDEADPFTFAPLGHHYSKDKSRVFWKEREIKGANPETFQIIDGGQLMSKDDRDYYFGRFGAGNL